MEEINVIVGIITDVKLVNFIRFKPHVNVVGFVIAPNIATLSNHIIFKGKEVPIVNSLCYTMNFDSFILLPFDSDMEYENMIHPLITFCQKAGKPVYSCEKRNDYVLNQDFLYADELYELAKLQEIGLGGKMKKINCPIIAVAGLSENTRKFETILSVSSQLETIGYKVSIIGTRFDTEVYGCYSFPFEHLSGNETENVISINNYVKEIEKKDKPDVIVIGVPGAILALNDEFHFDFGLLGVQIGNAISTDYAILNILCKDYSAEFFETMKNVMMFRLNMPLKAIVISENDYDISSFDLSKIYYVTIPPRIVRDMKLRKNSCIQLPFYTLDGNCEDVQELCSNIVTELS